MSLKTITVEELKSKQEVDSALQLIDVRTPAEYAAVHVRFAENVPLDELDANAIQQARQLPDHPLYVICKMGGRSAKACQKFIDVGIENVINVTGGTDAWVQAGYDASRSGKKVMALDRQVRISAGMLVVAGVVLSATMQPVWVGQAVAGAIGAGLVFSGLTDTCGMGAVLSKMPWNKS
ncbi:MAG: sulfurtransferase [Planctomycetaceae bacterium]|nr:sulfurtransferase [Planctomycetaceae bacterium]|tara:strand:- start:1846 stop:2382 length:537 start_codon:yes stop_codon:yes gene_type:complete